MAYYTDDFKTLCKEVIEIQGHRTCVISFSGGKDSIALFLRCLESGMFDNFVLFYYYLIPDLSWINEYFEYFEKKFRVHIIQVPGETILKLLDSHMLQTPIGVQVCADECYAGRVFPEITPKMLQDEVIFCNGLPKKTLTAVGVKANDSTLRRMSIKKHGLISLNQGKWYPVHDFKDRDIKDIMKKHDVKFPEDYNLFGLSFDGLDYRFLKPIKDNKPEDYKRIKEFFPLIDLVIQKREHYKGTDIRKSKFKMDN